MSPKARVSPLPRIKKMDPCVSPFSIRTMTCLLTGVPPVSYWCTKRGSSRRLPDDEGRRKGQPPRDVGRSRRRQTIEKGTYGLGSDEALGNFQGGQFRNGPFRFHDAVAPHHGDVVGHLQAVAVQGPHDRQRESVGGTKNGGRALAALRQPHESLFKRGTGGLGIDGDGLNLDLDRKSTRLNS